MALLDFFNKNKEEVKTPEIIPGFFVCENVCLSFNVKAEDPRHFLQHQEIPEMHRFFLDQHMF